MPVQTTTSRIPVLEMSCAACARQVEQVVLEQPGVTSASVHYATQNLTVTFDPAIADLPALRRAVQGAGYDLVLADTASESVAEAIREDRQRTLKKAVWGAGILAVPVMIISMIWMQDEWARWLGLFLTFPIVFGFGGRFFKNAWNQARRGSANMDTLVALSTGIAWVFSAFNAVFPAFFESRGLEPHVYFEAAAAIIFFILLGKYLEENAKSNTAASLKQLLGKQPKTVWRREADGDQERDLALVRPGDVLLVRPGDYLPVDGSIIEGESLIDESSINGEAVLQHRVTGDRVFAGTINGQGSFYLVAAQVGADTVLARIIRTVQEAQGSKAPVQRLADRIAAVFVPVVIGIAVLSFLVWWLTGHFSIGLLACMTVLVIACPCALGLATPTALMAGIGRAADMGILIKNAESLEKARKLTDIVLDKTGTLTAAQPEVAAAWWAPESGPQHKSALFALERRSTHPLAAAVARYLQPEMDAGTFPLSLVENVQGRGIRASVDGTAYMAGSLAWLQAMQVQIPPEALAFNASEGDAKGGSTVWFAEDDRLVAVFALMAEPGDAARRAVRTLHDMGISLHLVSGDKPEVVRYISQEVGIPDALGGALPEQKGAYIQALQARGCVVGMVGDGINDAEALALADVGIAMGHGADVAIDAADITLLGTDISRLPDALLLSDKTVRTIRQNLFWAFAYNLIGIPVAAGVLYPFFGFLLHPMIASAAMAMSSVSVVSNSLRLRHTSLNTVSANSTQFATPSTNV